MSNPESKPETSAPTSSLALTFQAASVAREQLDLLIERSVVAYTERGRVFEAVDLGTAIKAVMTVFRANRAATEKPKPDFLTWLKARRARTTTSTYAGVLAHAIEDYEAGREP